VAELDIEIFAARLAKQPGPNRKQEGKVEPRLINQTARPLRCHCESQTPSVLLQTARSGSPNALWVARDIKLKVEGRWHGGAP
jgi:hypothetical protein